MMARGLSGKAGESSHRGRGRFAGSSTAHRLDRVLPAKTGGPSTGTAAQNRERSPPYAPHSRRSAAAEQYTKMTSWAQVSKCWKVDDGDDFDAKALELYFPASKDHEGAEARKAIWKSMDNNNNKYVSLAEYDGWFNQSRSRRPVVWRCLHAIDATRLQE